MKFGRVLLIGFVLMLSAELTAAQTRTVLPADAQPPSTLVASPVLLVIPSQPLELALKAFSDATRVALFYESSVISGRRSFGLSGTYAADVALKLMLQGTGLSSTSFERGTITILAPRTDEASDIQRAKAGVVEFSRYLALVQHSLDLAFCQSAVVANEPDEMLARLWMAPSGEVLRADILSSTGSDHGDRTYLAMLAALAVDARPPAAMPQPINLMIMPKRSRQSAACKTLGTTSRRVPHE